MAWSKSAHLTQLVTAMDKLWCEHAIRKIKDLDPSALEEQQ